MEFQILGKVGRARKQTESEGPADTSATVGGEVEGI